MGGHHHPIDQVQPAKAQELHQAGQVHLVDVREPGEWEVARLPRARLVPLGQLAASMATLDSAREIVVMCRSGQRSATAARQLQAAGFRKVKNLAGGILRWSDEVDPSVPKY